MNDSVVITYLRYTYEKSCSVGGHSWQVINAAMKSALMTAIAARFPFELEDFKNLAQPPERSEYWGRFGFFRWIGKDTTHGYGELMYKYAIDSRNLSACLAYEFWQNRSPYIVEGSRLGIGSTFRITEYGDEKLSYQWWTVGSFSEAGDKINIHADGKRKSLTPKELKKFFKDGDGYR